MVTMFSLTRFVQQNEIFDCRHFLGFSQFISGVNLVYCPGKKCLDSNFWLILGFDLPNSDLVALM